MNLLLSNLPAIAAILGVMALVAVVEVVIPLEARGRWHRAHTLPNLALTFLTFATNLFLNTGLVLALIWLDARGFGILRWLPVGAVTAGVLAVLVLELQWYLLHRAMHEVPALWRVHRVHHSDPVVDVTTTIRQHPVEGLLRYGALFVVACGFGVGLVPFAAYRLWSAINGLSEHANVRIPRWLDRAISWVTVSPGMHRVHHSREARETDSNYGNILSLYDRVLGTFTPAARGRAVVCGLDGYDHAGAQTTRALLAMPFSRHP